MKSTNIKLIVSVASLFVLLSIACVLMAFDNQMTPVIKPSESTQPPTQPTSYQIPSMPVLAQVDIPAGCETYACTVTLQKNGFDIDVFEFVEKYLVTKPVYYDKNWQRYGPDMNSAYAGSVYTGYGVYAPAMAKFMNNYLSTTDSPKRATVLYDISLDTLCREYVVNDIPVMVWATTYMMEPYVKAEWIVDYVDENADSEVGDLEQWLQNEHCLVLMGYDETNYYFCDSVSGEITPYEKALSQERYEQLGSQAIVVQ